MNKINKEDIDFSKMKHDDSLGYWTNDFFIDEEKDLIYKIFSYKSNKARELIEDKLDRFEKYKKKYLSKPIDLIYNYGLLVGYSQKLIKGDTLYKTISDKGVLKEMKCILKASKYLEDLHKSNIIVSDMHFGNIMVNEKDKPIFIDIESYKIEGLESHGIPVLLNNYYAQKGKKVEKNKNSDIISFYLSLFDKILGREIYMVSNDSYNSYLGDAYIKELYPIFFELSKRSGNIPEVPYLHKVLKNYDNS